MCDIQTQCPSCNTQYLVSPTQLSIAQGTVCCPKCEQQFNAYTFLSHPPYTADLDNYYENLSLTHHRVHKRGGEEAVLAIFGRKLDSSNTDLLTYLNTHQFNEEYSFDIKKPDSFFKFKKNSSTQIFNFLVHMFLLGLNIILFGVVISQITNNNNDLKQQFPLLAMFSTHTCSWVKCSPKTSHELKIEATRIHQDYPGLTTITGRFVNYGHQSRTLPSLQVVTAQKVFNFSPKHYLLVSQQTKQHLEAKQTIYFRIDVPLGNTNQQFKLQLKKSLD